MSPKITDKEFEVAFRESSKIIIAAFIGASLSNFEGNLGIGVSFYLLLSLILFLYIDHYLLDMFSGEETSNEEKLDVINERTASIEEKIDSIEKKTRSDWHSETAPNSDVKQYRPSHNQAS